MKMKKSLILSAACLFWTMSAFAQSTVDLYPDYDVALGYHDGNNSATTNYATATQNSAFCIPSAFGPGVNSNRALIYFNLTQFPPGTQIQSATLDLYALGPAGNLNGHTGSANAALIQQVSSSWQETTVTWNTQPTYSSTNQVVLPVSTSPLQDYLGINVTALVQDMVDNPATNYGFGLGLQNEAVTNALMFCSMDHSNTNLHPRLHVTYGGKHTAVTEVREFALDIFPNPTVGRLHVQIASPIPGNLNASLMDLNGKIIASYPEMAIVAGQQTLDISALIQNCAPGMYLLRMQNGTASIDKKVVVLGQ
jgi:hypothetical protein